MWKKSCRFGVICDLLFDFWSIQWTPCLDMSESRGPRNSSCHSLGRGCTLWWWGRTFVMRPLWRTLGKLWARFFHTLCRRQGHELHLARFWMSIRCGLQQCSETGQFLLPPRRADFVFPFSQKSSRFPFSGFPFSKSSWPQTQMTKWYNLQQQRFPNFSETICKKVCRSHSKGTSQRETVSKFLKNYL